MVSGGFYLNALTSEILIFTVISYIYSVYEVNKNYIFFFKFRFKLLGMFKMTEALVCKNPYIFFLINIIISVFKNTFYVPFVNKIQSKN